MKQYLSSVLPTVAVITVSYAVLEYLNHYVILGILVPLFIQNGWMVAGSMLIPGLFLGLSIIAVSFLIAAVVRTIKSIGKTVQS